MELPVAVVWWSGAQKFRTPNGSRIELVAPTVQECSMLVDSTRVGARRGAMWGSGAERRPTGRPTIHGWPSRAITTRFWASRPMPNQRRSARRTAASCVCCIPTVITRKPPPRGHWPSGACGRSTRHGPLSRTRRDGARTIRPAGLHLGDRTAPLRGPASLPTRHLAARTSRVRRGDPPGPRRGPGPGPAALPPRVRAPIGARPATGSQPVRPGGARIPPRLGYRSRPALRSC